MITIIDYGVGNLRSILSKFERMRIEAEISGRIEDIRRADKLVLPGIGHFGAGMHNLLETRLIPVLEEKVLRRKTPLLGICLGMQLLTRGSEESEHPGLGWIDGETRKFSFDDADKRLRVPHVGWNHIKLMRPCPLVTGIPPEARFYFAHSFYVVSDDPAQCVATTSYGHDFVSILRQDNIWATQFHPEKSHRAGLRILENFVGYA